MTAATKDLFSFSTDALAGSARRRTYISIDAGWRDGLSFQTTTVATACRHVHHGQRLATREKGDEVKGVKEKNRIIRKKIMSQSLKVSYYTKNSVFN